MSSGKAKWRFDRRRAPIAAFAFLFVLPFAYASCSNLRPHFADKPSVCTVVSKEWSGDSEGTVDVVFVTARHEVGGVSYTGEAKVVYRNAAELAPFSDGKQVPCLYLASSPEVIALQPPPWSYPLGYGFMALVVFGIAIACFWGPSKEASSPF